MPETARPPATITVLSAGCRWRPEPAHKRRLVKIWHDICRNATSAEGLNGRPPVNAASRRRRWPKASVYSGFYRSGTMGTGVGALLLNGSPWGTPEMICNEDVAVYVRGFAPPPTPARARRPETSSGDAGHGGRGRGEGSHNRSRDAERGREVRHADDERADQDQHDDTAHELIDLTSEHQRRATRDHCE